MRNVPIVLVVAYCTAMATYWAIRMPLFQNPDELAHLDYAFYLADVGKPFTLRHARPATRVTAEVRYIADAIGYQRLRYNPFARVAPDYGSRKAWSRLDEHAPTTTRVELHDGAALPYVMFSYPPAYYAMIAASIDLIRSSTHSLYAALFAARFVNVALLGISLGLSYRLLRMLDVGATTISLGVLGFGALPVTSAMAGAVQPDNLAMLLVVAVFTVAAGLKRATRPSLSIGLLCVTLTLLALTKPQYAVVCWLPLIVTVACGPWKARTRLNRCRASAAIALLPGCALLVSLSTGFVAHTGGIYGLFAHGATSTMAYGGDGSTIARYIVDDFANTYAGGPAFVSYWFRFGIRGATVFESPIIAVLEPTLIFLTLVTLSLVIWNRARVAIALVTIARHRHSIVALLGSAPWIATYVLFTIEVFVIDALTRGTLGLQGRYWIPVAVSVQVVLVRELPRLIRPRLRRHVATGFAAILAAYALIAGGSAALALQTHYYTPTDRTPVVDALAAVDRVRVAGGERPLDDFVCLGDRARFSGYAIDMVSGLPAKKIHISIDGSSVSSDIETGLPRYDLLQKFNDDLIIRSGFAFSVFVGRLSLGAHLVRLTIVDDTHRLPFAEALRIVRDARCSHLIRVENATT